MMKITKDRFKYCLDLYVIRDKDCYGYCCKTGTGLIDKIKIAKRAGFDMVEIWHKDVIKYIDQVGPIEKLSEEISKIGVTIPSYKFMQYMEDVDVIEMASKLGCNSCVVKIMPDNDNSLFTEVQMIERYNTLLDFSSKLNIRPSLEFMSLAKSYNSINLALDIIDKIDHPLKSIVLDTWHLWRNDDFKFSNCPFERVDHNIVSVVHFTDARREVPRCEQRDSDRKMPGEGLLDLHLFCDKLNSIGFEGVLSLNVYDKSLWDEDQLKVAERGFQSMHDISMGYKLK